MRTKPEINQEYTQCAMLLGDKMHRIKALKISSDKLDEEIKILHERMDALMIEPAQPEQPQAEAPVGEA